MAGWPQQQIHKRSPQEKSLTVNANARRLQDQIQTGINKGGLFKAYLLRDSSATFLWQLVAWCCRKVLSWFALLEKHQLQRFKSSSRKLSPEDQFVFLEGGGGWGGGTTYA